MNAQSDLKAIVEQAYELFERYRLDKHVDVCKCPVCLDDDSERKLLATPLRKIDTRLLSAYTHAAKPTDPRVVAATLRYFLPRYFDLIANDEWPVHFGEEATLRTLHDANFPQEWPTPETEVIDRFFHELFRTHVLRPIEIDDEFHALINDCMIEKILCLIARANGQVGPRLALWDATSAHAADVHLALLIAAARQSLPKKHRLSSAFWADAREIEKTVVAWILRPATQDRLEAAFHRERNPALQSIFSVAHRLIESLMR